MEMCVCMNTLMCMYMLSIHTDLTTLFVFQSKSIKHCFSHLGSFCVKILSLVPTGGNNFLSFGGGWGFFGIEGTQCLHFKVFEYSGYLLLLFIHKSKRKV